MSLSDYLDLLEGLPLELQRNLKLMRDLDAMAEGLMGQIHQGTSQLLQEVDDMDDSQRYNSLKGLSEKFGLALKQGEDKVALAAQTYHLADQTIRRLDAELARFESEELVTIKPIKLIPEKKTRGKAREKDKSKDNDKDDNANNSKKRRRGGKDQDTNKNISAKSDTPVVDDDPLADVIIDPDEPTYCYCNQVSYGEMVGCDDETCVREWFHYTCVGLKTQPKGKWYCNDCLAKRKATGKKG